MAVQLQNFESSGSVPEDLGVVQNHSVSFGNNLAASEEMFCPSGSTAVCFTDDLNLLAVGQENGSVGLFENGEQTQLLYDCEMSSVAEPCTDIKFKSSQKNGFHKSILVTYLGGHIKLWDTKIGKCLFTMKEKRQIFGVNYHPINAKFVTFGNDFKVYLYDEERRVNERILACSEIVGSKNGHTDSVCSAKFHPKNPFEIVSAGFDGTIQYWDLRTPHAVRNLSGVVNYGEALDVSQDGRLLLVGISNSKNCVVRVYDYETGEKLFDKSFKHGYIYTCKFLTASHVGVGCFLGNSFRIINLKTGEVAGSMLGLPGCVISLSAKQKILQQKLTVKKIPIVAISTGERVMVVDTTHLHEQNPENNSDFLYR